MTSGEQWLLSFRERAIALLTLGSGLSGILAGVVGLSGFAWGRSLPVPGDMPNPAHPTAIPQENPGIAILGNPGSQFLSPTPITFIPAFPTFNSQRLDQQIRLYAQYLATSGPPDVLVIGSSRSLQGVDPVVLQEALVANGHPRLRIYNFGVNGATARVVDLVLRRILTPSQLPRLILWADGSRALNSARVDVTYNGIAASEGYKRLAMGERPIQFPIPFQEPTQPPEFCTDSLPIGVQVQAANRFSVCEPSGTPAIAPSSIPPVPPPITTDLNAHGFQVVSTRFNPTTYYQQFPRVSGRYDTNYTPFRLEGEQTTAAIAIAAFARTHRIPLIFVNLPLTQDYLDPVRSAYEQQFRQHMERLAAREGFLFRDLIRQWTTQNDYFADPSHLNRDGARAVAQQLALDATIPWVSPRLPGSE